MIQSEGPPHEREHGGWIGFLLCRDRNVILLHGALVIFALTSLYLTLGHSPWRDEAQPWLFARDLDLRGLFFVARHNGHPILWFLCLKALQTLGFNYIAMEVLNWLFCLWGIWLLFYYSALPLVVRIGVALSPICIFEISCTARDYAIVMPLIFLAACFFPTAKKQPLRYSVVLALMASTNVFAAAVFVGISLQFLLEQAWDGGEARFSLKPVFTKYLLANAVLSLGAVFLVLQLAPIRFPGDPFPSVVSVLHPSLSHLRGLALFLLTIMSIALVFFGRTPRVIGALTGLALAGFPIVMYGSAGRYLFMLVLGLVYYCWVYLDDFLASRSFGRLKLSALQTKLLVSAVILLPAFRLYHFTGQFNQPVSDSRGAAQAIIAHGLDRPDTVLVCADSFRPAGLYLFLKNIHDGYVPPEYGPSPEDFALDGHLDAFIKYHFSADDIQSMVLDIARQNPGKTVVVVVSGPATAVDPRNDQPSYHLTQIYRSPPPYPLDELFRLFVLDRPLIDH